MHTSGDRCGVGGWEGVFVCGGGGGMKGIFYIQINHRFINIFKTIHCGGAYFVMHQVLTDLHSTHESSSAVQHFKHNNGIMSDYYLGLSRLLLLLGGGTVKCMMGHETRSFLWSLLNLHHLKN